MDFASDCTFYFFNRLYLFLKYFNLLFSCAGDSSSCTTLWIWITVNQSLLSILPFFTINLTLTSILLSILLPSITKYYQILPSITKYYHQLPFFSINPSKCYHQSYQITINLIKMFLFEGQVMPKLVEHFEVEETLDMSIYMWKKMNHLFTCGGDSSSNTTLWIWITYITINLMKMFLFEGQSYA